MLKMAERMLSSIPPPHRSGSCMLLQYCAGRLPRTASVYSSGCSMMYSAIIRRSWGAGICFGRAPPKAVNKQLLSLGMTRSTGFIYLRVLLERNYFIRGTYTEYPPSQAMERRYPLVFRRARLRGLLADRSWTGMCRWWCWRPRMQQVLSPDSLHPVPR